MYEWKRLFDSEVQIEQYQQPMHEYSFKSNKVQLISNSSIWWKVNDVSSGDR